jgi:thioredoxin
LPRQTLKISITTFSIALSVATSIFSIEIPNETYLQTYIPQDPDESLVQELSSEDFEAFVKQDTLVAMQFHANWCGPCRCFSPIVDQAAYDLQGLVQVVRLNIDNARKISQEQKIRLIPTVILFRNGQEVNRQTGSCSLEELKSFLSQQG